MIALTTHPEGTVVPVRAHAGARREGPQGERGGALRLAVAAAPERGKANAAIAGLLAEGLECRPSEVRLLTGAASRDKSFLVTLPLPSVRARLEAWLAAAAGA